MKRMLYLNRDEKLFELRENEYVYLFRNKEFFFYTKDKINRVYLNKNKELMAESNRHIWNLNQFSYVDKETKLKKYTDVEHSIKEFTRLYPFKEYTLLCMETLKKNLKDCPTTRFTASKDWLKKQYDYNLYLIRHPDKLNTMINYIYNGNYLNDRIVAKKLSWLDRSYIKKLDDIFKSSPKLDKDTVVYRGIHISPDKFDITQFDSRYVSTSLLKEKALDFSGSNGILMIIKVKKDSQGLLCFSFPTHFSNETELLLPRKVTFVVKRKTVDGKLNIFYCDAN